jgi:hypothetical protein
MELATKVDTRTSSPSSSRGKLEFKLDHDRLMSVVEEVFQRYGLDPSLLDEDHGEENQKPSLCKYAYVPCQGR